jgi:hypothetical protein
MRLRPAFMAKSVERSMDHKPAGMTKRTAKDLRPTLASKWCAPSEPTMTKATSQKKINSEAKPIPTARANLSAQIKRRRSVTFSHLGILAVAQARSSSQVSNAQQCLPFPASRGAKSKPSNFGRPTRQKRVRFLSKIDHPHRPCMRTRTQGARQAALRTVRASSPG